MPDTYSILLVELKRLEEDFISTRFSQSGHVPVKVSSVVEAIERMKSQKIDLLYLQSSGNERDSSALNEILAFNSSLPIVMVCEKADGCILDALRSGRADILFSPMNAQSLDASLKRNLYKLTARSSDISVPTACWFFYLDENGKECRMNMTAPRFTLGRNSENDLVVGQREVSRFHAEVLAQGGGFLLRDLNSKMGTYLNGTRVKESRLTNGDRIQLGSLQGPSFSFHTEDLLRSLLSNTDAKTDIGFSLHGFKEVGKLFAAFRALSFISVLDDLLSLVVDTAIELSGAERGFVMLKEKDGELSFRCARSNNQQPLDRACFQTSHRIPKEVFRTGRAVVIKDLGFEEGSESHAFTRQLGLRSVYCVPLRYTTLHESISDSTVVNSEIIGVLCLDSSYAGSEMSKLRLDALETLASEAAIAIYNARLYKDFQDKRRMDEQLAVAREIQQALLPQPDRDLEYVRACSRSLPCYEIGGDYFDYFNLENERFGFALGDVAGKGIPAALLASLVQGMFSSQSFRDIPLTEIMGRINRNLVSRCMGNRFVTFFFGILDPEGYCTYVNAGHNPPILLSRDGNIKELNEGGMVLGLLSQARYEMGVVRMQPGDHLVLYTDGVVEALNAQGEEFGMDRLTELLRMNAASATPSLLACIEDAVLSFSDRTPQHDDITMMVLGFRKTAASQMSI